MITVWINNTSWHGSWISFQENTACYAIICRSSWCIENLYQLKRSMVWWREGGVLKPLSKNPGLFMHIDAAAWTQERSMTSSSAFISLRTSARGPFCHGHAHMPGRKDIYWLPRSLQLNRRALFAYGWRDDRPGTFHTCGPMIDPTGWYLVCSWQYPFLNRLNYHAATSDWLD